ncbi:hypothetical protein [Amycolatopsis sp. CFH S0078]|uniref:hypothetical protein n=1 Tax=Amycolatopsis sp. CFH S0078 TaxID=1644108 RepID=UPI00106DE412|nr:hypothetical protein [Amycolatopsis sp. CFH S0078]
MIIVTTTHPLTAAITGDDYIEVLLERQTAWLDSLGQVRPKYPPLLEWFVQDGDEQWVQLPEHQPVPKPERKPRAYRSAESLREERDRVQAQMDVITGSGSDDAASVNLSPRSRNRAAARAGRARFAKLDRDLERYAKLSTRLDRLDGRLKAAEAREARA